jgi:tRNA pseudouridine55 synthase
MNGVVIVDKPAGFTSHDVVNRIRHLLDERAVGHLGTLDPMATGVLPLVLGRMTRLAQFYNAAEKTYEGEIRLGFATDTYDATGEATGPAVPVAVEEDEVRQACTRFAGEFEQMPPPFSAKKIAGVPAYKLARKKREVTLKPVKVKIKQFDLLGFAKDRVRFHACVSSGTYLRTVAHELGAALRTGGHLSVLRRSAVAEFDLADAHTLDEIEAAAQADSFEALLVHPRRLLPNLPSIATTDENVARIRTGQAVNLPDVSRAPLVKVFRGQTDLIAIASRVAGTLFHPKIVLMEGN